MRAARPRARGADAAEADLQPPGPRPRRRLTPRRPLAASSPRFDELVADAPRRRRAGARVHPVPRDGRLLLHRHLARPVPPRPVPFLHGGVSRPGRDRDGRARSRTGEGGPAADRARRRRAARGLNLTARQPGDPLRPLVEPGRGGPGHRPGVAHRPGAHRHRPQARVRGHRRGAHRTGSSTTSGTSPSRVVGTGEAWLSELSTDSLRELLVLKDDR